MALEKKILISSHASSSTQRSQRSNRIMIILLILLIVCLSLLKFAFPVIDLPSYKDYGASNKDDQTWVNSARNKVLFGEWANKDDTSHFVPYYIAPLQTIMFYASFIILGVSTFSMHIVAIICSLLSAIILFFALKEHVKDKLLALLGVFFFSADMILFVYSKSGLAEMPLILFMVLTYFLVLKSFKNKNFLILIGPVLLCCLLVKLSALFFVILTVLFLLYYNRKDWRSLLLLVGGGVAALLIYFLFFFLPNYPAVVGSIKPYLFNPEGTGTFIMPLPGLLGILSKIVASTGAYYFFIRFGMVFALAALFMLSERPSKNESVQSKLQKKQDGFVFVWVLGVLLYLWLVFFEFRRIVPIIPPLTVLAVLALRNPLKIRIKNIFGLALASYVLFVILQNILKPFIVLLLKNFDFRIVFSSISFLSDLSLNALATLVVSIFSAAIAIIIVLLFYFKKISFEINLRKYVAVVIIFSLLIFLAQYIDWVSTSTNALSKASDELGQMLPENAVVLSRTGGLLGLENKLKMISCESEWNYTNDTYFIDFVIDGNAQSCLRIKENADYILVKEWPSGQTITDEGTYDDVKISAGLFRIIGIRLPS